MFTNLLQHSLPQRVVAAHNAAVEPGMRFFLLREAKNESQQTLSVKTGGLVTDQTISNFEVGKTKRMQPKIWQAIANALEISVDQLNEAVYGETIVMTVPASLGDDIMRLIESKRPHVTGTIRGKKVQQEEQANESESRNAGQLRKLVPKRKREQNGAQ